MRQPVDSTASPSASSGIKRPDATHNNPLKATTRSANQSEDSTSSVGTNTNYQFHTFTIPMLQAICGAQGLRATGKKKILVDRLNNHFNNKDKNDGISSGIFSEPPRLSAIISSEISSLDGSSVIKF